MKMILVVLSAITIVAFQSCRKEAGNGPSITKTYSITGFTSIDAGIDGDVYYTQDSEYKVEIYAQQNILDKIETPIENGQLRLQFRKYAYPGKHNRIVTHISSPLVSGLSVNGSGSMYVNAPVSSDNMTLKVNGSGYISMSSFTGTDLSATVNGSGRIAVNGGSVVNEDLRISGSGDLDMLNLFAQNANVHTSGSGNTSLYAGNRLDIFISGSGNVYYRGNPSVSTSISGSGKVTHQ
jgi:hypothetical protein